MRVYDFLCIDYHLVVNCGPFSTLVRLRSLRWFTCVLVCRFYQVVSEFQLTPKSSKMRISERRQLNGYSFSNHGDRVCTRCPAIVCTRQIGRALIFRLTLSTPNLDGFRVRRELWAIYQGLIFCKQTSGRHFTSEMKEVISH